MADPELRIPQPGDETRAFHDRLGFAFSGSAMPDWNYERQLRTCEQDRMLALFDGDQVVGTAGIFTLRMSVPGNDLDCAGVTRVSVASTHRRRGLLRRLMRRQLDDIHQRGEPLAALYASQAPIYGRFGYGLASWSADLVLPRARSGLRRPMSDPGRVRFVSAEGAMEVIPGLHERLRHQRPGGVSRSDAYWSLVFEDPEPLRGGASELHYLVHEDGAGAIDGVLTYRQNMGWSNNEPNGGVRIGQLLAANATAYAALWRFATSIDLTVRVVAWSRPVDEPLRQMLADPRALRATIGDQLWLRLVDVGAALAGRSYAVPGRVRLQVSDEFCPWNAGTWELEGGPEGAVVRRLDGAGDIAVTAEDLAAAYLGGTRAGLLAWTGRLSGSPAAVATLDAMLAVPLAPWCPTHF